MAVIGAPSVLAGVVLLATDPEQVNHTFGWGLVAVGIAVMTICGAMFLLLSQHQSPSEQVTSRADNGSVSIIGDKNIAINMPQLGGIRDATEKVHPNVVFDGFAPVREQLVTVANISQDPRAEFACLRFVNEPERKGPEATVPDLHARIEIGQSGKPLLTVEDGRWAENVDREQAPGRETKSVPLPGNGETRTLNIAMQRRGEEECYGWSHGGRQIPDPSIPKGVYAVRVELDGSNMETRTFLFDLVNNGKDDFLELREAEGVSNPCSARWTKLRGKEATGAETERVRRAIAAIDPLIGEAQAILESCGRPREQMIDAGPMYFQNVCIPRINKFALDATATIREVAPEYIGKFQNVGNVTHETDVKPAMIQQMERWLDNLGAIQDELRKRL